MSQATAIYNIKKAKKSVKKCICVLLNIYGDHLKWLNWSNAGKIYWVKFLRAHSRFKKRKKNLS